MFFVLAAGFGLINYRLVFVWLFSHWWVARSGPELQNGPVETGLSLCMESVRKPSTQFESSPAMLQEKEHLDSPKL